MMRIARKTKTISSAAIVGFLLASITGCAHSPPTRYVTLSAEPASSPRMTTLQPIQLTAVHIPAELDRPEVVTQDSANQLTVHDNDRWGAPLAPMMRRTLAQDLLARLPANTFILPDAPAPPGTRTLVVTVLNSEADANGTLTLQVSWALLSGHPSHATQTQQLTLTANMMSGDAAAQAAALSQLLGQLADRIAASIVPR
ncbi:PqiC family protein [Dyella sp.]|uniref:PqiC family protein n=1 Tax=Dyella sp. TaxID=1869338 RepID=UPI002B47FB17|nr:PqiC family protein [Dyella sp.]HKT29628.1 PqiC family protein [Dyella sp.]